MSSCVDKKLEKFNVPKDKQEVVRDAMNKLSDESRKIDQQRVIEETNSVFGSMDVDKDILDKINDGTYKVHTDKSAILSLIDGTFGRQMLSDMIEASKVNAHNFDEAYYNHITGFVETVKNSLQNSLAHDIIHKFIVVDTDNENTTAFWASDNKAMMEDGTIDGGTIVVLNGKDSGRQISNNGELLLHEFAHSVIESALANDGVLSTKMSAIQTQVMKQLNANVLTEHISPATIVEQDTARNILRYVNGDVAEFLAYYISNANVFHAVQSMQIVLPTFDGGKDINAYTKSTNKFKDIINKIISVSTNGPTAGNMLKNSLGDLIERNMQIKSKVYTGKTFDNYANTITNGKFNVVDKFMHESSETIGKHISDLTKMNPATRQKVDAWIEKLTSISVLRTLRDSGVIQSILHTTFKQTTDKDVAAIYQLIRKVKAENDKEQNSLKESNARVVNRWYKDISLDKRSAITSLLAADTNVLGLDRLELADLLADPKKLDEAIRTTGAEVSEDEYRNQAMNLGYFLQHNEVKTKNMETNAYRIYYRMYVGKKQSALNSKQENLTKERHEERIKAIDKLTSLYALKYMDQKYKDGCVELMRDESAVIGSSDIADASSYHVVDATLRFMQKSVEDEHVNFDNFINLLDKGYMRRANRRPMQAKIASEDMLNKLSKQGYGDSTKDDMGATYLDAVTKMKDDGKKYYMIARPDYSASRTQGAIHDIGFFDQVQQMKDIYDGTQTVFEDNKYLVEQQKLENESDRTMQRKFVELSLDDLDAKESQLMRVIKMDGTIADYSMPMSNKFHERHMEGDRDVASVLASTVTHRSAKNKAIRNNIGVLNYLISDEKNHVGDPDYVVLRAATKDEKFSGGYKYSQQWNMIPEYARIYISSLKHNMNAEGNPDSILIHKDMIDDFIGYKDVSIANFKIGEKGKYFNLENYPVAQLKAAQIEYFWKKMIARYKTVLVLLDPHTIAGNAISNMNIAYVHGIDPKTYTKAFIEHWKQLDEYNSVSNEMMVLEAERDSGMHGLDNRIEGLRKRLKANTMHSLIEDGQFGMIVEDVDLHNNKEDHVEYQKRRLMEKLLGKNGNEKIKALSENIVATKSSQSFKLIEKLTNYNDIINRRIIQEKMLFDLDKEIRSGSIDEKDRDAKEQEILNYLDQLFVNYSYLDSKYVKYINDVGLFMFTKYFFRALKTLKQVYEGHPLSLTMFLGMEAMQILPKELSESPYDGYVHPLKSFGHRAGPAATFDFSDMAKKILMPGTFDML
jgi:hypothetical protein